MWSRDRVRLPEGTTAAGNAASLKRSPFVYGCTVCFFAMYYYRPEDFIKPIGYLYLAKISGILGFAGLVFGLLSGGVKAKIPTAVKILWLLLLQMTLCIPSSLWPGGSFQTVYDKFAKGVVVAMMISMAVVAIWELRRLLWIQVSAVALVTFFSIVLRHYQEGGRLSGIQESILQNPNDLAINIAISFPLCMAFMLRAKGFWKVIWTLSLLVMALGVVLTSSRSGLLALILSIAICVWEYGVKGKRGQLVALTALATVLGLGVALSSPHYRARVASIISGSAEGDAAGTASLEERKALFKKSVVVALTHPLLGVGPGSFRLVDQTWLVAHNAYTELAAESGIPALILFLMAMGAAFKNISLLRKSQSYRDDPEFRLFTQALWAGLVGYMAGSCFASTEYNLYPYFVIGYTCAMVRIASPATPESPERRTVSRWKRLSYIERPSPALTSR
jgi:O-antigen ligase